MGRGFGEARRVDPIALARLIDESGIGFRQTKRSYVFTCPRCSKKDKLMMFKADGRFVCWVCAETSGFKGRPEFALTELLGMSFEQIKQAIYGDSAAQTPTDFFNLNLLDFYAEDETPDPELIKQVKGISFPLDFYPLEHQFGKRGLDYVLGRNVSIETIRKYDLRYCPVQQRVIIPVKIGQKLVGWQARFIKPTEWYDEETDSVKKIPKILTTGKRDSVLMFQDNLAGSDHAVITEGPFDAFACELVGGNVATMGKVVSQEQIEIIKRSGVRRIYVGLDRDAATETMKLARAFDDYWDYSTGARFEVFRLLPPPEYEDLGATPPQRVVDQVASAPRLSGGSLLLDLRA